jgi:archaellum biogenesis protein FlaJ (TadC family)
LTIRHLSSFLFSFFFVSKFGVLIIFKEFKKDKKKIRRRRRKENTQRKKIEFRQPTTLTVTHSLFHL